MRIRKQDYNDVTVVELQGELDHESIDALQNTVTEIIGTQKSGIVLDMQSVEFVDSAGLERLLWARDYCDANGCQLKVANLNDNCSTILELTRLDREFDCYSELAEAVKSFA
jgi:anti-sigma B factor antagonist